MGDKLEPGDECTSAFGGEKYYPVPNVGTCSTVGGHGSDKDRKFRRPIKTPVETAQVATEVETVSLAPPDDAPRGFKNVVIKVNGNAMVVSCQIKLATSIK
jgi:hypothetical protein